MFVREVQIKCLRRFFLRCRGSHGSSSLHALRAVSLYFPRSARFSKNTDISGRGAPKASAVLLIVLKNVLKLPIIFYEWKKVLGGKIPYSISMKDDSPFVFAGLWEGLKNPANDQWLHTSTSLQESRMSLCGRSIPKKPSAGTGRVLTLIFFVLVTMSPLIIVVTLCLVLILSQLALPSHVNSSIRCRVVLGDLKRRVWVIEWGRAVRSPSPSWRAPYAASPRRYSAAAGSALWSPRISCRFLREFSVCYRPTRIAGR